MKSETLARDAVEGAIVGAVSVGIDSTEAASAAVEGAVEAVLEAGGDLRDVAKATVGGVVSGMAATGGDVVAATRDAAYTGGHPMTPPRNVALPKWQAWPKGQSTPQSRRLIGLILKSTKW